MAKYGRIVQVQASIRLAFGGKGSVSIATIAEAMTKLMATHGYTLAGGTYATIVNDCRRALVDLRSDGLAAHSGTRRDGTWTIAVIVDRDAEEATKD